MTQPKTTPSAPETTPETKMKWTPPTIDVVAMSESESFENFGVDGGSFS